MDSERLFLKATPLDTEILAQHTLNMGFESEGRIIDKKQTEDIIAVLFQNDGLGSYYKYQAYDSSLKNNVTLGTLMVTWKWDIYKTYCDWWVESVYVVLNQRRVGVFRHMFKEVEKQAFKEGGGVCLYVHHENPVAINTYENMGMYRYKDVTYEDDLFFSPVKGDLQQDPSLMTHLAGVNSCKEITDFIDRSGSLFNKQFDTSIVIAHQIQMILNKTQSEGHILLTKQDGVNTMMTSYFMEFSDWRKGIILWVYDLRILDDKKNDPNLLKLMIQNVYVQMKNLDIKLGVGCVRFIFDEALCPQLKDIMEGMNLTRTKYFVYGKDKV